MSDRRSNEELLSDMRKQYLDQISLPDFFEADLDELARRLVGRCASRMPPMPEDSHVMRGAEYEWEADDA